MEKQLLFCLFLSLDILLVIVDGSQDEDHTTTFEQFYELGMDAYRLEKWSKCSTFLQRAIKDFHFYKNATVDCRLRCKSNISASLSFSKLQFFHEMIEDSNCLRRCKKKTFGMRQEGPQPSVLDQKFEKRVPYNFLQFCLFKEDKLKEAAAAAYTYYITNQDDKRVIENLQYYRSQAGVTEEDFVDLERRPHQSAYVKALTAYNEGDWKTAAEEFESSLELYFKEEERCRAECERPFTHTGYPDFVMAVADHYIVVIVCQQRCLQKLSTFGMEEFEHFVSEHYNFLQFAFYKIEDYEKAAVAVANFLLFRPNNAEMVTNKDYYMKDLEVSEEKFTPSQDVIDYLKYWSDIEKSLDFIRDTYTLPNDIIEDDEDLQDDKSRKKEANGTEKHYMEKFAKVGIRLFAESEQLKGTMRFAADEFFREDQCLSLADLAKSQKPNHIGVTSVNLPDVMKLVNDDEDYEMSLRLLLRAGDIMQHYTTAYFNQSKLYIMEVKVVCRAGGDKWEKEMPLDCIPQEDGSCQGDTSVNSGYLSIAYLSDISDGTGSFYFMDSQHKIQSSLQPRCGRLVGFTTDDSYGVNFSWKKERCALMVTFTSDPELEMIEIQEAKGLLADLEEKLIKESKSYDNTAILKEFYRQGVSVVKTGEDLFGEERFAADGLATEKECDELISLAKKYGRSGDGYKGNAYPHTDHEIFTGLDVAAAVKQGVLKGDGYDRREKANPRGSKFVSPYTKYESFAGLNISRAVKEQYKSVEQLGSRSGPSFGSKLFVKLVAAEKASAHSLQLLLDISEQGRLFVERYFNLTKPLFFDFTHLVCRTAVEGSEDLREEDLSHPVHSDNCMIQDDGSCIADDLAYSQRHYSALLYLNGDFDGGQFFFAHKNRSEQVSLQPKCGRIVGFNAGEYHGVKAVTKGQRCALAIWLTHDPNFKEISRAHAQRQLDIIQQKSKLMGDETGSKSKSNIKITDKEINVNEDDNLKAEDSNIDNDDSNDLNDIETNLDEADMKLDDESTDNDENLEIRLEELKEENFVTANTFKKTEENVESNLEQAIDDSDKETDIQIDTEIVDDEDEDYRDEL